MMKKALSSIALLFVLPCIFSVSVADTNNKIQKIEKLPQPYSESDLYGYWFDAYNTPEIKILKLMILAPDGVAIDSLLIQAENDVEEVKQESRWRFDPKSSVLTQEVTSMTYTINGKVEPKDLGKIEPVKVSVVIQKSGDDIYMGTVSSDGTLEIYQKITKAMKDEIHKKAHENVRE